MELALAHVQLLAGLRGIECLGAMEFEQMAHEVRCMTMRELTIFFSGMTCTIASALVFPRTPIPWRALPPKPPGVWCIRPGLIYSPKRNPGPHLRATRGPFGEDQPLDRDTAPVALQQSRILCLSVRKLASLCSLAMRSTHLSRFECYKPSRFDRTATCGLGNGLCR